MRRRLGIIVVALGVIYALAHLAMREFSTDALRSLIERNLSHALGLDVSIDGLMLAMLPTPRLHAEGVRVANFPDRLSPHLLEIDRLEIGIAVWPLTKRIVVVDQLTIEDAELHLETNAQGRLGGGFDLGAVVSDDDNDSIQLELRHLQVKNLRVFHRDGRDEATHSLVLDSLELGSQDLGSEISLDAMGTFEGSKFALSGRLGSLREILKPTGPFPVDLRGQLFEADVEAKGTVRELWALKGLELDMTAEIPELVVEGHALPQLGAIRFAGQLSDLDGSLGFERLRLNTTKSDPLRIELSGKIDDLLALKDVDLDIALKTGSLDFLNPLVQPYADFALPTIAALFAKAKLSHRRGSLSLDGSVHATTAGSDLVVNAKGNVRDLTGVPKLDVKLDTQAQDLASLTALMPGFPKHGPLGPVSLSARLNSQQGVLGASEIAVRLGSREKAWAEADGAVADVFALRGVAIELTFGATSLHHLKELLARELPETSLFVGSGSISDTDGSLGLEHLRIHGGKDGPVEIHLETRFDDLPQRDEIEIEFGFRGADTRVLGALAGIDLPVITPVEFRGQIEGSDEKLTLKNLALRLGETRLLGSLSGSFAPHVRPTLKARLTSKNVRMQDLGLAPSQSGPVAPGFSLPTSAEGAIRLPFDELRRIDLDVGLQIDQLGGYQGLAASDVHLSLQLEDGALVSEMGAIYQQGNLNADVQVDARTPIPKLKIGFRSEDLNLARAVAQFRTNSDYSGLVDANLDLQATGDTLDALRQSLAGRFDVSTRDGNVASRIGREFVVDLLDVAFPRMRAKQVPSLGCAVAVLDIEEGIANVQTLFLKEKEISASGTGKIDLVHGLYDLRMFPATSNPGILGFVPEVLVKGPLEHPEFHPVPRTLVTSFGVGFLKNAFGAAGKILLPFRSRAAAKNVTSDDCRAARITASSGGKTQAVSNQ